MGAARSDNTKGHEMMYADPFDDPTYDPNGDPADYTAREGLGLEMYFPHIGDLPAEVDEAEQDDAAARWLAAQDAEFVDLALRALAEDDEVLTW